VARVHLGRPSRPPSSADSAQSGADSRRLEPLGFKFDPACGGCSVWQGSCESNGLESVARKATLYVMEGLRDLVQNTANRFAGE
jgi:hypothetical protein